MYETLSAEDRRSQTGSLEAQLRASRGFRAQESWKEVRRVHEVLRRNSGKLIAILEAALMSPALQSELMQNVRQPDVADEYFRALDQRLHNALAAAGSLIDQTRRFFSRYQGTDFADEFDAKNDAVREMPESQFIRDSIIIFSISETLPLT